MHTELNEHSHFYVLCSSKLLAVKTEHDPKLKVGTPFAQVCACPLCLAQDKRKQHNAYNKKKNPRKKAAYKAYMTSIGGSVYNILQYAFHFLKAQLYHLDSLWKVVPKNINWLAAANV